MYSRRLTECFPHEDLPALYECLNVHCFYFESLLKASEIHDWKNVWSHTLDDLIMKPHCSSCGERMEDYNAPIP